MNILFRLGSVSLTRFGLTIALAAAAWTLCALWVRRARCRRSVSVQAICLTAAWMLALGLIASRAVYCAINYDLFAEGGALRALYIWEGGHSISGALLGALMGIGIGAKRTRTKPAKLARCFAPGFLLFACAACAARRFAGEGWGKATEAVWLAGTPLTVADIYGETRYAVYRMEACAYALCFFVAFSVAIRKNPTKRSAALRDARAKDISSAANASGTKFSCGDCLSVSLALYSLFALTFSSMREGNLLRIGYIRVDQVFALLLLIGVAIKNAPRLYRTGHGKRAALAFLLLILGAALVAHMEFAVDREGNLEGKYACMLAGSALSAFGALFSARRSRKHED